MQSQQQHWNDIYRNSPSEQLSWYQEFPKLSLDLISRFSTTKNRSVIDIGCGESRLVDHLFDDGVEDITLVDLSSEVLNKTKSRLDRKNRSPVLINGDVTKLNFNREFDIWHDRAVFHFLTEAKDRRAYMANLVKSLSLNGRAIIATFSLNGPTRCSDLEIVQYDEVKMRSVLATELAIENCIYNQHIKPDGNQQAFNYFVIKHQSH